MIAAIVVLYEPTDADIEHIVDYYNAIDQMIILDNSNDSCLQRVKEYIGCKAGGFIYRHYPQNIGLCAALNIGMVIAKEHGHSWVLLMDEDSSLLTDIIGVYKKYIQRINDNVAVLAPVHIHDRSSSTAYKGTRKIKWAMTSGCLYRTDIFFQLNGFMEELFVDGLDVDYCYKARENGYVILECGEAVLQHHPAETLKLNVLGKTILNYGTSSPWRYYMQARCAIWMTLRYKSLKDFTWYIWKLTKVVLFFKNKKEYICQVKKGTKEGITLYIEYKKKVLS